MTELDISVLQSLIRGLGLSTLVGAVSALLLLVKSVVAFTRTGPKLTDEVLSHYRVYLAYSLGRLTLFVFLIVTAMAFLGVTAYVVGVMWIGGEYQAEWALAAALTAVVALTARVLLRALLYNPGVITSSSQYSPAHFYPLWDRLTPAGLRIVDIVLLCGFGACFGAGLVWFGSMGAWLAFGLVGMVVALYGGIVLLARWNWEPAPAKRTARTSRPNILMIGADTLRADRLNGEGYPRDLTPNMERFARRATRFTDCYVPCARTAPSLVSMLTSTWPHTHGVRDTFITLEQTKIPVAALPALLRGEGYRTAAVGDWAASDMARFDLGFEHINMPDDQWNIKYLLRQGPKDMRLFLALFMQNCFGKKFLPELYYLGGHPLAEEVGRDTRREIARLAKDDAPFCLMSFMAITHPPFTSKYPYYAMFADRNYRGPSKFAMAKLRDPFEIIRSQGEPKTEFDLDQIIDLYDGCVKNFDDELQRVLDYLEASGLADNTIVVIFSDHGFEFFEHETWGQGNSAIGDFSARVPLLIADPRQSEARIVKEVVRTVDLAPTLLELLGRPVPGFMEGASLVPLMRGEELKGQLPAFYETGIWLTDLPGTPEGHLRYPSLPNMLEVPDKRLGMIALKEKYRDIVVVAKDRMIRVGDWKLSYQPLEDGEVYQLFNIREDPACSKDVLAENPKIARELRTMLERWMSEDLAVSAAVRQSSKQRATDAQDLDESRAGAKTWSGQTDWSV